MTVVDIDLHAGLNLLGVNASHAHGGVIHIQLMK